MFESRIFIKCVSVTANFKKSPKRVTAFGLMLALLIPIGAPFPVWAYNLNLPPIPSKNELSLYAPSQSFLESTAGLTTGMWNGVAELFSARPTSPPAGEMTSFAKEALESRVSSFQTQLPSQKRIQVGQAI
jgi:hypothetical protein